MRIEKRKTNDASVVAVGGEINLETAPDFRITLLEELRKPDVLELVVDLTQVPSKEEEMRKSNPFVLLSFVLILLTASDLRAQSQAAYSDEQIKSVVEHDLAREGIEKIEVEVSNATVTLRGQVRSLWARKEAVQIALKIHDVKDVVSELTIAAAESDQALAKLIQDRILRYVFYTIYDEVGISVQNGVVTLAGRVTMPYKANEIAEFVSKELGVQQVQNEIRVLPVSTYDDQIRTSLAVAIYREFPDYAIMVNPPIHIIVENGRVTLEGIVRNQVERRIPETIARSTFGVFSVVNRLRVGN